VKPVGVTSPVSKIAEKPKIENPVVEEDAEDVDTPQSQSPKSAVKPVQKNTLLKWVIKKTKSEEESNGALEEKGRQSGEKPESQVQKPVREPELICLDSNSSDVIPMDIQCIAVKTTKETVKKISSQSPLTAFFKNHANRSEINQRELLKLQTAPLKNTELLEASIAENVLGAIPMEVETVVKSSKTLISKSVRKIETVQKRAATNSESHGKSDAKPSTNISSTSKSSPVSSSTAKPPRRIQLITLTGAAPKKEKGNLD